MKIFPTILLLASLCCSCLLGSTQDNIPVIKASSKSVDIRDGLHYRKQAWYILPEKNPDIYYVEIPRKETKVSFITDRDSISFDIKYGGEYKFIILLNGRDSCHTTIVAKYKTPVVYQRNNSLARIDSIPFRIGNNSKIYLNARINGSDSLNVQFDLGNSGAPIIKKKSVEKVRINFTDSIKLTNSDGVNIVPFSRFNKLVIGELTWQNIPVAVGDNMTYREDLIIGNYIFQDKIVEIDYDKRLICIHDTLPHIDSSYSRHDMALDAGTVPLLHGSLLFKSKKRTGWFLFDTGAYTTILDKEDVPVSNKMITEAKGIFGIDVVKALPALLVGNYEFSQFNYTTQDISRNGLTALLGNDLLKRFNVIIDNRNGYLYLKPNSLTSVPYANPEYYFVRITGSILLIVILTVIYIVYRRRQGIFKIQSHPR